MTRAARSKSSTCGRVKLLQVMRTDGWCLRGRRVLSNPVRGFFESPAASVELEKVTVMHQAVEERCDDDHVAEQGTPVLDWAVRGNERGGFFVATHEDISEFVAGACRQPTQEQIVDDGEIRGSDLFAVRSKLAELT